ncbi:MAG TPA: hypothetical protein VNO14_15835, partial [Blastocatellia bacterium]|nr:hypothetical protein [Blastocatellia bacterium]
AAVGDSRKWGTPFYVIIERRDLEDAGGRGLIARRVHTVSGEMIESEAQSFIDERLSVKSAHSPEHLLDQR